MYQRNKTAGQTQKLRQARRVPRECREGIPAAIRAALGPEPLLDVSCYDSFERATTKTKGGAVGRPRPKTPRARRPSGPPPGGGDPPRPPRAPPNPRGRGGAPPFRSTCGPDRLSATQPCSISPPDQRHSEGTYFAVIVVVQAQRSWPEPTSVGVRTMLPAAFGTVEATVTTPVASVIVMPLTYLVAPGNT